MDTGHSSQVDRRNISPAPLSSRTCPSQRAQLYVSVVLVVELYIKLLRRACPCGMLGCVQQRQDTVSSSGYRQDCERRVYALSTAANAWRACSCANLSG